MIHHDSQGPLGNTSANFCSSSLFFSAVKRYQDKCRTLLSSLARAQLRQAATGHQQRSAINPNQGNHCNDHHGKQHTPGRQVTGFFSRRLWGPSRHVKIQKKTCHSKLSSWLMANFQSIDSFYSWYSQIGTYRSPHIIWYLGDPFSCQLGLLSTLAFSLFFGLFLD